jgi:hypothetical protein
MKLPHLVIPLALALAGATATSAAAHQGREFGHNESPVVGHAYVNDNTAVSNTVAGFDRHADGSLTPISVSAAQGLVLACRRRVRSSSPVTGATY